MTVRNRAFDHTLVGNHGYSREEVLGSNPTTPKHFSKRLRSRQLLSRNAPSKGHHSRYIALFLKGTYSVDSSFALMRKFFASLQHFLRYF